MTADVPVEIRTVQRAVVVVAAGAGTRLGAGVEKAFVGVAGLPMLERALAPLFALADPTLIVVVAPESRLEECRDLVARAAGAAHGYTEVVAGGADRHASVEAGLRALPDSVRSVLVHDAARCLAPVALFERVFAAVGESGDGVVPALPVTDTVKRVHDATIVETVDRSELVGVQTPQGFPLEALRRAYRRSSRSETDDAGVFQSDGGTVRVVQGEPDAFKITTAWDLRRAEGIIEARRSSSTPGMRVGVGVDVHAFDDAVPCRVGTIDFPDEPGLSGHSDGDAVAHALCDALLAAGGLGDIGGRFGTDDPRYAGAAGSLFIRGALTLLADAGLRPISVSVVIIGNRPRVGARRLEIERALTTLVGAPVAVSATTTDRLGFTGRGEGLAAIATALASAR